MIHMRMRLGLLSATLLLGCSAMAQAGQLFPPEPDSNGFLYWDNPSGSVKTRAIPPCTGANAALQWNGTSFSCAALSATATATPAATPTVDITGPNEVTFGRPYTLNWISTGGYSKCRVYTACPETYSQDLAPSGSITYASSCGVCPKDATGRFTFAVRCWTAAELNGRSTQALGEGGITDSAKSLLVGTCP